MSYLALAKQALARLEGQPSGHTDVPAREAPKLAPVPPLRQPGSLALTEAAVADFATLGITVAIRASVLDGGLVYLVPDEGAVQLLLECGVPRHRIYLPEELLDLFTLFAVTQEARPQAVRVFDAIRETFGPEVQVSEVWPR